MLQTATNWTVHQKIRYSELGKTIKKRARADVRKFNCEQTQKIIEETNSAKSANKFLPNGASSIIAMKRPDSSVTNKKNEILALTTEFYRNLYDSKTEIEPTSWRQARRSRR